MECTATNNSSLDSGMTEYFTMDPMRHPSTWGEIFLRDRDGSPRRFRDYQVEDLECASKRIAHLDGRAVGKTINLSSLLLWFVSINKGKSVLVAAPYQGHLDAIIDENCEGAPYIFRGNLKIFKIDGVMYYVSGQGSAMEEGEEYYYIDWMTGDRCHLLPRKLCT